VGPNPRSEGLAAFPVPLSFHSHTVATIYHAKRSSIRKRLTYRACVPTLATCADGEGGPGGEVHGLRGAGARGAPGEGATRAARGIWGNVPNVAAVIAMMAPKEGASARATAVGSPTLGAYAELQRPLWIGETTFQWIRPCWMGQPASLGRAFRYPLFLDNLAARRSFPCAGGLPRSGYRHILAMTVSRCGSWPRESPCPAPQHPASSASRALPASSR
jgi:hypothetical protein